LEEIKDLRAVRCSSSKQTRMNDDYHSTTHEPHIEELVGLLKKHGIDSEPIKEFLDRHQGMEYFGEIQSVLDIKELLDIGLIR